MDLQKGPPRHANISVMTSHNPPMSPAVSAAINDYSVTNYRSRTNTQKKQSHRFSLRSEAWSLCKTGLPAPAKTGEFASIRWSKSEHVCNACERVIAQQQIGKISKVTLNCSSNPSGALNHRVPTGNVSPQRIPEWLACVSGSANH
jgi:hypothetical protein